MFDGEDMEEFSFMLSPLRCICLEQSCLKTTPIIRLRQLNNISAYIDHLQQHVNLEGDSCRFSKLILNRLSVNINIFTDKDQICAISVAPRTVLDEYDESLFAPNCVATIQKRRRSWFKVYNKMGGHDTPKQCSQSK